MPRAKQRTNALRAHVVDVALATLASDGVSGLTTRNVARQAETSTPAVYELFGDKAGLVRELFFEGFRRLRQRLDRLETTDDPRADLLKVLRAYREFVRDNPELAQVMFSRSFADFDPGPDDVAAGSDVRQFITARVRRCIDARILAGNEVDVAHVLLALAQGLAAQESAGWLGTSKASIDRRWDIGARALIDGLSP
jgi:AcrR family transcriptional regulator